MHRLGQVTPSTAPLYPKTRPRRHTRLVQALITRTSNTRVPFLTIATRKGRAQSEPLNTGDCDADGDVTMDDVSAIPPPLLRRYRSCDTETLRDSGTDCNVEPYLHSEPTIAPATTGPRSPARDAESCSSTQAGMLSFKRESDVEMGRAVELSVDVVGATAGPPSPAATVVCDDEPLPSTPAVKHPPIKVRDFAYPPFRPSSSSPATSTSSLPATTEATTASPCISPIAASRSVSPSPTSRATSRATSVASNLDEPRTTPATEIFDPLTALAEVDFRFACSGRVRPIPGRSLRRLLDLGWLTEAEIAAHALPVDYDSLAAHDSRPYYPWRPVRRGPTPEPGEDSATPPPYDRRLAAGLMPCDAERRARARQVGPGILAHDRRMAELARDFSRAAREAELLEQMADMFAANAARKKREEAAAAAVAAALAASSDPAQASLSRGGARLAPARSKRRIDETNGDGTNGGIVYTSGRRISSIHDKKKRRITPEPSRAGASSQPPTSGPYSPPPHRRAYPASQPHAWSSPSPPRVQPRQYPAPAYAYDLQTHPELAARFGQQAQVGGAAKLPPGVGVKGKGKKRAAPLQRVDTLPIEVDTEVDTEEEDEGKPLQRRPSAMDAEDRPARPPVARGLARTHTIAQLAV